MHGGQFTQLDEARYLVSREASALLAQGHLWQALAFTINGGDHVGFKVLALIPALIERHYALGVAGPALFFAGFSLLNIGLIGLIGWRLSGSRAVQFWATLAAAASGINIPRARLIAFVVSGAIMGMGGALYSHSIGIVTPDTFYLGLTFITLSMLVVGGMGSLSGAVLGVLILSTLIQSLRWLEAGVQVGETTFALPGGVQEIALGAVMILILMFRPAGIMGNRDLSLPGRAALETKGLIGSKT